MSKNTLRMLMLASAGLLSTAQVYATDWLMLLGTEPEGAGAPAKVFGVLQPTYQYDTSEITGPEPTRIGPNLEKQQQFQLQRAMLGVRGVAYPIDSKVNYMVLAEFGSNAATDGGVYGERTPVRLMDASVTLNHIAGARVRVGLFKTPGPEELLQAIPAMDYINFTDVANQLMLERFPAGVVNGNGVAPTTPAEAPWTSSYGAARDHGLQVFDSFHVSDWTHSYAVMIGNGNGLQVQESIADGPESYLYWSSEKVYGGTGPTQQGLKFFLWHHAGKREVDLSDDGVDNPLSHKRTRYGLGVRYRKSNWRLAGEYMAGKGMIFQGPEKPNFGFGTPTALQDLDGKANGWYADVGYYIPNSRWQLDARFDQYNRSTDHQYITARYQTTTVGFNYHLNPKTRITFNYAMRNDKALDDIPATGPLVTPLTNLHSGLEGIKDRYALQLTMLY